MGTPASGVQICGSLPTHANIATTILAALAEVRVARPDLADWCERVPAVAPLFATAPYAGCWAELPAATAGTAALLSAWRAAGQAEPQPAAFAALEAARALLAQPPLAWPAQPAHASLLARCLAGLCADPAAVARALAAADASAALVEALDEPALRGLSAASLLNELAPAALPALLGALGAAKHPARSQALAAARLAGQANPTLAGALVDALLPHDPAAAAELAAELAEAAPTQLGPRLALGRAYRAAGRNAEASKLLAQALREIDITAALTATELAEAEAAQGREPEARQAWARALARDPQHTRAALSLARQARQSGRTARADRTLLAAVSHAQAAELPALLPELYAAGMDAALAEAIERAAAALPADPSVAYHAGLLRERSGALPEAEAAFAHAAVLAPRWHAPHTAIARTLHARGDLPAAAAGFEQALRREPSSAEALAGLSRVRADQGDRPAAITLAQALVQSAPEAAGHHALLADLLLADGRAAEAIPAARAAAERTPNAQHLVRLATAQQTSGAHADALGTLRDAQARLGDHPDILPLLAAGATALSDWPTALEAYSVQFLQLRDAGSARGAAAAARGYGDMALARAWLARALRCDPADTQSWLEAAAIGRDTNRPRAAIRAYKRALTLGAPASAQCQLAQAYAQAGELACAQACAEDYLKQAPDDTAGWLLLGQLRARQGDRSGALAAAERLADLPQLPAAAACWLIDTLATAGLRGRARAAADEAVAAHAHDAGLRTRRAGLLLETGALADARADALAALARQPELTPARLILARVQLRERSYSAARATLAPLAEDPQHAPVVSPLLAEALEGCGQPAEALPHAVRALQQSRADRERIARVARLLLATGQAAHAATLLQAVSDQPDLLILRAQAHAASGSYAEARRDAEAGLALTPNNAGLAWAATAVLNTGAAPALAQRRWLELAERFPASQAIRHSAAQAALAAGDANAALVALRPLLAHGAATAETALLLGRAYVGAGRVQDAVRTLRYAIEHIADQALRCEARLALAEAYLALGWADDARATLDAALAETPAHAQARRLRAQLALDAGQLNAAAADLGAITDETPEAAELQASLAARQGDWVRALAEQRRACMLAPTTAHLARLAELGAQAGDSAAQIEALEALTERAPESVHWAALARAYAAANDLSRASAAWRKALGAGAPAAWWAEHGALLVRAGEVVPAQRAFAQALTIDPTDAASAAALANLSAVPAERVELLRLATRHAPHSPAHWRSLAAALGATGARADERQALQRAWSLTPDDHGLAGDYAEALIAAGERPAAIDVLNSNCALPSAPAALLGRLAGLLTEALPFVADLVRLPAGADLARQRLTAPAEALLAEARARDAATPAWWLQAARLRVVAGEYAGALALLGELGTAALSEIETAETRVLRAAALARTGALAQAAELARGALATPEAAAMHAILAEAAHAAANPAEARTHAQAARQAGADSPQLLALWGLSALALSLPAEACEALELALEQASQPAWLEALSRAYSQLGRRERALNYAARAVRAAPEVAAFQHQLATLYQQQHQLHDARAALMRALSLEPEVPAWHAQMAEICTALGMAQAANQSLARARALAADDPEIMVVGARLRAAEGDAIAALGCYRQAIEQAPERVEWLVAAAELARDSKQIGEFARYAYSAVERAPGQAAHWLLLAEAVEQTRDQPAAFVVLEQGLEHCRNNRTLVLPATRLALALEHPAKAQALIDGWLDQSPDDAEAWELAGVVAQRLNEGDVAQRALERAVTIAPRRASAHAALARLALARELPDQALRAAANASDYDPINRSHNVLLARALQCAGRLDEARAVIRPILPEDLPLETDVVRWYAELQLVDGDPERAIVALDLAIEQMPALPELHLWAGRAHRQLRHYRRAITHLRRAIRLRPSYPEAIIELSSLGPLAFAAHAAQSDEILSERTA